MGPEPPGSVKAVSIHGRSWNEMSFKDSSLSNHSMIHQKESMETQRHFQTLIPCLRQHSWGEINTEARDGQGIFIQRVLEQWGSFANPDVVDDGQHFEQETDTSLRLFEYKPKQRVDYPISTWPGVLMPPAAGSVSGLHPGGDTRLDGCRVGAGLEFTEDMARRRHDRSS